MLNSSEKEQDPMNLAKFDSGTPLLSQWTKREKAPKFYVVARNPMKKPKARSKCRVADSSFVLSVPQGNKTDY